MGAKFEHCIYCKKKGVYAKFGYGLPSKGYPIGCGPYKIKLCRYCGQTQPKKGGE